MKELYELLSEEGKSFPTPAAPVDRPWRAFVDSRFSLSSNELAPRYNPVRIRRTLKQTTCLALLTGGREDKVKIIKVEEFFFSNVDTSGD